MIQDGRRYVKQGGGTAERANRYLPGLGQGATVFMVRVVGMLACRGISFHVIGYLSFVSVLQYSGD